MITKLKVNIDSVIFSFDGREEHNRAFDYDSLLHLSYVWSVSIDVLFSMRVCLQRAYMIYFILYGWYLKEIDKFIQQKQLSLKIQYHETFYFRVQMYK